MVGVSCPKNEVGLRGDNLLRDLLPQLSVERAPANADLDVATLRSSRTYAQFLPECSPRKLDISVSLSGSRQQHADAPHPLALLRERR